MEILKIIFWILIGLVIYSYIGYGIVLFTLVKIRRWLGIKSKTVTDSHFQPEVTLFIPAFNEAEMVEEKMKNSLDLDYPPEKLHILWVTDGSDDGTPEKLRAYPGVEVLHEPGRNGKIGAMNRGMRSVRSPIVIFSDANTMLSQGSVQRIVTLFRDPSTGCVSGEKRIVNRQKDSAAGAGEGLYWRYESLLKKWDSELYSAVGAAGELFAIRTSLFEEVERDTLLDDFMISMRIAMNGYRIRYDPDAYATETASANVKEELKRKIRISAGGIQSVIRLSKLLNIFKYGTLSFQYISHRVLRWTIAPLSLILLLVISGVLAFQEGAYGFSIYSVAFWLQVIFYMAALLGWYLENRLIRIKLLFVPYYFFIMNLSVFLGFKRFIRGTQSVNWARAKRGV